jgi:hypothetical protein
MPSAIRQFPHCDELVLHREGSCEYCDAYPEWQELRALWGINFTGESDPNKIPCPSTHRRSLNSVHAWPGNRPRPVGSDDSDEPQPEAPKTIYDHLRENKFSE